MPYSRRHYGLTPPPPQRWTTGRAASFADSLVDFSRAGEGGSEDLWQHCGPSLRPLPRSKGVSSVEVMPE
jgi:hypothetical protein